MAFPSYLKRRDGRPWVLATALFALAWIVARAAVQSITIDEADTYLAFVSRFPPFQWYPASNNHVLNSLLMRLFTSVFGTCNLTVRAPALLGAALYISAAYGLCGLLRVKALFEWALFTCCVLNPFVLDYLVAARGYSLAAGFLLWAVLIAAASLDADAPGGLRGGMKACGMISVFLALSFSANFSFALIDAALLSMLWTWISLQAPRSWRRSLWLFVAATLPGLLVSIFLTLSVVLAFPRSQLWYGATSLRQTLQSVYRASLYQPNPNILSPLVYQAVLAIKPFLLPALGIFTVALTVFVFLERRSLCRENRGRRLLSLAAALSGALALALCAHWICFRAFHLLLPRDRTALFLAVLPFPVIGLLTALPLSSRAARFCRRGLSAALVFVALYFAACLRLTYFKEWIWNADMKNVYSVLAYYNHAYGVKDIGSDWRYTSALNYYRAISGHETLAEFAAGPSYPIDRKVYVLPTGFDNGFMEQQRLKVVYRDELSGTAVAIRPELETGASRPDPHP